VTLLTGDGELAPEVEALSQSVSVATAPLGPYALANFSRRFAHECLSGADANDVIHTHGVWLHPNWTSAAAARRLGKPLVVSPRGMLEPWSLAQSRRRKRLLWRLVERRSLAEAAFVHATSRAEAENLRQIGVAAPIAVIPNGIDLVEEYQTSRIEDLKRPLPGAGNESAEVLFLGRVHPKKGLALLLEAWQQTGPRFPAARLMICGPGDSASIAHLERQITDLGMPSVQYRGAVSGVEKIGLLARASVLVLPSLSENYGIVVAEALAAETPVITTTETPWSALGQNDCGWSIRPEVPALIAALEEALSTRSAERRAMGRRGRALIEREHSLERVGRMMARTYAWVLGRSERPEWVGEA